MIEYDELQIDTHIATDWIYNYSHNKNNTNTRIRVRKQFFFWWKIIKMVPNALWLSDCC